MKNIIIIYFTSLFFSVILLTGCTANGDINKVGMLVEHSINDQTWGSKGYQGLLQIKDKYNVDVYFKEEVKTQAEVNEAVDEFINQGVNLIFGHSSIYGKYFDTIKDAYPDIHFVYFNGAYEGENLTSLHFNANAMGFFAGMVAGEMTKTNQIGIIGAYEWQPEIEGFYEGVNYQNPDATISMNFVNSWDNVDRAFKIFSAMNNKGVDVFYPAGDSFSQEIIKRIQQDQKYAIGFVTDQSHLGDKTVLTSTVQHVDKLYVKAAEQFNNGELNGGIFTYDFQDEVISLGTFSSDVPQTFKQTIKYEVEQYKETGLLPNER
ncbi:Purine-binding protein precursor [Paraliobacillus sp. PM-2]|uniref:BMP family ABC transporter substrate-binding protein n=1 Tax=Paraliobacillus sp. PM-2 TaxID=1462524 RepID=UPI00061C916F|nr:BMP family ABC transporter substrate-binding protein [Paraliobacillus sp. PM-2]CQR46991.1 Purine-binding protein precursor [Paraliobacillus sp. PM-2]